MMTSWKKTKQLDDYLFHCAKPEERLVTEAQLLLDGDLRETLRWQQQTYAIVRQYGRQQLRREIQAAQHQLFRHSKYHGFRQIIYQLFSKR